MAIIIAKVIQATIGLRVTPEEEMEGLDRSQHAETAYILSDLGSSLGLTEERPHEASRPLAGLVVPRQRLSHRHSRHGLRAVGSPPPSSSPCR